MVGICRFGGGFGGGSVVYRGVFPRRAWWDGEEFVKG